MEFKNKDKDKWNFDIIKLSFSKPKPQTKVLSSSYTYLYIYIQDDLLECSFSLAWQQPKNLNWRGFSIYKNKEKNCYTSSKSPGITHWPSSNETVCIRVLPEISVIPEIQKKFIQHSKYVNATPFPGFELTWTESLSETSLFVLLRK